MPTQNRNNPSILVIDDEPQILRAVRSGLLAQGYDVHIATDGAEALREATTHVPDMVVLDVMLPGEMNGLEVCRRLREWTTVPILILSALGNEQQKVKALDLGADDYLTKPFGMDELTARVRAALRRSKTGAVAAAETPVFNSGSLCVDFGRRIVSKLGGEIKLTPLEYDILKFLTLNPDRVVTHRQLLSTVWGSEYSDDTQLLRVHVGNLRRKIEDDPGRPRMIVTEPGVGYRFKTAEE
jgi:two-component system, OmpR family, KDP operon response regulator KdpE